MNQPLSNEKENRPLQTDGSRLNTLEDTSKNQVVSNSAQVFIESLSNAISEVDDPTIYLVVDRVKRVGGKSWVQILDIADVRRAK